MILEGLAWALTPCPRAVRAMGYLTEAVGIAARHRRCRSAWAPHLERSRAVVERAAELCPGDGRAVVLGAGLFLDVPLAALRRRFRRVDLVDIVFLPWPRIVAAVRPGLRLVPHDVTGAAEAVERAVEDARSRRAALRLPPPGADLEPARGADLVVSLNLVSQLSAIPRTFVERRLGTKRDEAVFDRFARGLVEAHLDALRALAADGSHVAVVTDLTETLTDPGRPSPSTVSATEGVTIPWAGETWTWPVAPPGEIGGGRALTNTVLGVVSISAAPEAG